MVMLSPEQLQLLPLILLLGVLGGMIRVLAKGAIVLPSIREDDEGQTYIEPGFLRELFVGAGAAFVAWAFGEITDVTLGALVTALLSGYAGIYVLDKFAEIPESKARQIEMSDEIAAVIDIMEEEVRAEIEKIRQEELTKNKLELTDTDSNDYSSGNVDEDNDDKQKSQS